MNKSVLMIMGGAVVVAILVAVVVQAKLSPKAEKTAGTTTEILVANKKLVTGERIKAENVRWQAWPEGSTFKGIIKRSEQEDEKKLAVYDTPLRRDVEAGEPLTMQAIISDVKGSGNFLAASIGAGMRAVAIAVKANTSVGGFISPGDHVDVILSYTTRVDADDEEATQAIISKFASQTVLTNVKVLGVDQVSKGEGREAKVPKTVTIEVSREQAEILALADKMGDLSLALRRLGEKDTTADLTTPLTTDATTSEVLLKVNKMMQNAKTNSGTIRVYNGSAVQNVPVRTLAPETTSAVTP